MNHPKYTDYAASNYGRIKSIERDIVFLNGRVRHYEGQLINPRPNKKGYLQFNIKEHRKLVDSPYAHRFIYECFNQIVLPKGMQELQINHIDENPSNNRIENLELCSPQYNIDYSQAKAVGQYTIQGELVKIWKSTMEAEREGGFMHQAISKCCRNCFNREGNNIYKNFIWKYIDTTEMPTRPQETPLETI